MKRGKFQYYTATTIDGFIADENHSLDWLFEVKGGNSSFADFFAQLGAFVMGRSTFDWIIKQEDLLNQPEKWKQYHGDLTCWVFTHRPLPQESMIWRACRGMRSKGVIHGTYSVGAMA
jgi:dihydrofolate reductase